jgi:RES domain-containing protein
MILAWRIVSQKRATIALTGEGASRNPGRWNMPGSQVVYVSGSLALAALEIIANAPGRQALSQGYVAIPISFDEALVQRVDLRHLPDEWAQHPPSHETQALGTHWAIEGASAVLAVPSSIIPIEHNFLINPHHPDFCKISIGKLDTFSFDKRLLR